MLANKENNIDSIWDQLSFPNTALLNKRVPKKLFFENCKLLSSDKKLLQENIKSIYWKYTLKPSTCSLLPYTDNEREYLEIAVLEIELNSKKSYNRIFEIIHRSIPYPLFLVCCFEKEFALSIAPKRFSHLEHGAFVTEEIYQSDWLNTDNLQGYEEVFINSLTWSNLSVQNYNTLYSKWIEQFIAYECAIVSGNFVLDNIKERAESLNQYRAIENQISDLRRQFKKASFREQVERNVQIKRLELELKELTRNI